MNEFMPVCRQDLIDRDIVQLDFVYITGDAYVDHPSFAHAVIGRVLEANGYSVGIIAQPDWKDPDSITILGEPRLGFLVSGGNMDSMVNHYSVSRKRRKTDAFTPGGVMGKRPDHAVISYCNLIRQTYKHTPIIIGGIEASLRRMAHYDYWSNSLKRSILLDSGADLLSYGMGERSIVEIADALASGIDVKDITFIDGTVYKTRKLEEVYDVTVLPAYSELVADKINYAKSFYVQYCNTDPFSGRRLAEPYPDGYAVVQNPPQKPLSQDEMDRVYSLNYQRKWHPMYDSSGGVPALEEVKYSLVSNRGCFGACSFCALTFHQGRIIQARSHESLVNEAKSFIYDKDFKGYIHDVGGPTANFRKPACKKQMDKGACMNRQCLYPRPCKNMDVDHSDYLALLRKLRALPNVKKVFIRSGIRFDYVMADKNDDFFRELIRYHVSGQLKVAPEHVSEQVLKRMGKPENSVYRAFVSKYQSINKEMGLKQYLVPYLMSSHPGSTLKEAVELAEYLRELGYMPEQVQDFYPTPSTLSTCMYYTGVDPRTMERVYVPVNPHEKAMQRALIQYRDPKNYDLVKEALILAHRTDLIGFDQKCLIRPRNIDKSKGNNHPGSGSGRSDSSKTQHNSGRSDSNSNMKNKGSSKRKAIRNVHKKKG